MDQGKVICDTDVIIDFLDEKSNRHSATKSIVEDLIEGDRLVISLITQLELMGGRKNNR
jgi:predicted nucleic acid-binding protein